MEMIVQKHIGLNRYTFVFTGKNLFEVVLQSKLLAFSDLKQCGICQKQRLILDAYITKEQQYHYTVVRCLDCKAQLTFGQPKSSPDTFYFRTTEDNQLDWRPYDKGAGQ